MLSQMWLFFRKRAVSSIMTAILLIGLIVIVGVIGYFVVLPMLTDDNDEKIGDTVLIANSTHSYIRYSQIQTEAMGNGWAEGGFGITNKGNRPAKISEIAVDYFDDDNNWTCWKKNTTSIEFPANDSGFIIFCFDLPD